MNCRPAPTIRKDRGIGVAPSGAAGVSPPAPAGINSIAGDAIPPAFARPGDNGLRSPAAVTPQRRRRVEFEIVGARVLPLSQLGRRRSLAGCDHLAPAGSCLTNPRRPGSFR